MADGPGSPRRRARAPRASRNAADTTQTSALKQEDAYKRKAELEAAVRKKIVFERKALHIVEQLLEESITEEFLRECGKFITPAHYSDVVDERSIIKLCGYPLCQKKLGIVPKQKYKISTKTNKVYDITERKCFCSNFCYKASKLFEAQIPKTPVWVREEERYPDFQLLQEGQRGHSGIEVQLCNKAVKTSDVDNPGHFKKHYESSSSSTHSDSSSDNEQDFVSSILPGNRPNATAIRPQLHKKCIMKKKAGQKSNSQHEDKERTIIDVTEQLGNCRLDSQEKAAACELPLQKHDATFPLIDSSSQNQIRKRIILEKLSKVLPGLLEPLQITIGDIYTQLKNLVQTFRLTNRNIIHKPAEWTLIAMVLLSLLTPILGIQKHSQENVVFTQFITTLLEELHLRNEDLESLTIIFRTSC
nr:putative RNA polymerase II subunit B1 CTD phosphatase RPAP2 isoform X4 [Manis javanica]